MKTNSWMIVVPSGWLRVAGILVLNAGGLAVVTSECIGQASSTGSIEGRVINTGNERYLENALVRVQGSTSQAFTDSSGYYRIHNVPAGAVTITVTYTGFEPVTAVVTVTPGASATHDFKTNESEARKDDGGRVKLSKFVVEVSREMDASALAINEQRVAPNMKTVFAVDEFGPIAEDNVMEFLKYLPGITLDRAFNTISLEGAPTRFTNVTVGGFDLASAAYGDTSRNIEVAQTSSNNISRVDVIYSPTPETPASALTGSVNFVPRSAMERSKAAIDYRVFLAMRQDYLTLGKTPGPGRDETYKVRPGFDFSYVKPVNQRFGFVLTASASSSYYPVDTIIPTWRGGAGFATNGGTLPNTAPDRPYLSDFEVRDRSIMQTRAAFGVTFDYKWSNIDRLSFAFNYGYFGSLQGNYNFLFLVNRVLPGAFTTTETHGFPGAGEVRMTSVATERTGNTIMPTLTYRHDGRWWKAEAGAGYSRATNRFRNEPNGYFNNTQVRRTGVGVSFDDILYRRPNRITVTDGITGAAIDPYNLSNYAVSTASTNANDSIDMKRSGYANLSRDFDWKGTALTVKAGLDVRQSIRDLRAVTKSYTFVGADRQPSTSPVGSDDNAARFLEEGYSTRPGPFGFPKIQWQSNADLLEHFKANPSHYTFDENASYVNSVDTSKYIEETVSSGFMRGDLQLWNRRIKFTGGVRAEQTNIDAQGPLNDLTLNYQRNASGNFILGANGRPLPIATTPLAASKLTRVERGKRAKKEYLNFFPSINASFDIRPNLIARAAYYNSIGRPDYNQYAGPITLPDTDLGPTATARITVNNAEIKPWTAKTSRLSLEYYFAKVGVISFGVFRRDFTNFFRTSVFEATPEFLALYDLDPNIYGGYLASTQMNSPLGRRMEGYSINYKQELWFLPNWARGVSVFGNANVQRATGTVEFYDIVPKTYNWGIGLSRDKFNLNVNWNYRSPAERTNVAAGLSIDTVDAHVWQISRLTADISGEYRFTAGLAVFANLRDVGDAPGGFERYGPTTPLHARLRQFDETEPLWTFGIRGSF